MAGIDIDWEDSFNNACINIIAVVSYSHFMSGIIYILLSFTPALWSAFTLQMIGYIWDISIGVPGELTHLFEAYGALDKTSCMNTTEIAAAITSPDTNVSGWYGPGAYLAWLVTAWSVAISSIASSKLASKNPERLEVDAELIAVVFYPLVAAFDILVRLIRCKIDAGMTAATFVMVTALSILSPMKRLSIQQDGSDLFLRSEEILNGKRAWTIRVPRWIFHGIISSVLGEAYANRSAITALWILLFITLLYSGVVGHYRHFKDHYTQPFRPFQERVGFFIAVQVIFFIVLLTTGSRSFWPQTSASLFDLDQAAALVAALLAVVFSKAKPLKAFLRKGYERVEQLEDAVPRINVSPTARTDTARAVRPT